MFLFALFVVFGKTGHDHDRLCKLLKEPLTLWTSCYRKIGDHHNKSDMHKDASLLMSTFCKRMEGKLVPVDVLADSVRKERDRCPKQKNNKVYPEIIKSIITLGKKTIPFRVYRDDSKHYNGPGNPGNFQMMLDLCVESGDRILRNHFQNCSGNAIYRPKTTQNELRKENIF